MIICKIVNPCFLSFDKKTSLLPVVRQRVQAAQILPDKSSPQKAIFTYE